MHGLLIEVASLAVEHRCWGIKTSAVVAPGPSCPTAIFPDHGSNLCLLQWQADSQPLDHQGSPTVAMLTNNVVPSQPLAVLTLLSAVSGIPVCTWDGSAERNLGTLL